MISLSSRLVTRTRTSLPPSQRYTALHRNLRAVLADGASFSVMVGIGETYVPAFALAVGLGEVAAGLVATVPLFAGSVLQMATPWLVRKLGTYRRWVVGCACSQACSLLAMSAIALNKSWSGWWIFVAAAFYWAAGLATGPAWNTWVEHLVPRSLRASFFATRVRISQGCILVGLISGGLLLRWGTAADVLRTMFGVIFAIAALARFTSASMLATQSEVKPIWRVGTGPSHGMTFLREGPGLRLVFYLMAVQTAVYLSGPYFTPYMLTKLELSYMQYTLLLSAAFLGKIVALPWFGIVAKRAGAVKLLWFGGLAIVPVAALWLVSDWFPYLLGMQFVAGILWASYELAVFLLFFETVPREERVAVLTWYNLGNSSAMVAGALLGAWAMSRLGDGTSAYLTLFALSSLARGVALILLPGMSQKIRATAAPLMLRVLAVRPSAGAIESPLLPSVDDADEQDTPDITTTAAAISSTTAAHPITPRREVVKT